MQLISSLPVEEKNRTWLDTIRSVVAIGARITTEKTCAIIYSTLATLAMIMLNMPNVAEFAIFGYLLYSTQTEKKVDGSLTLMGAMKLTWKTLQYRKQSNNNIAFLAYKSAQPSSRSVIVISSPFNCKDFSKPYLLPSSRPVIWVLGKVYYIVPWRHQLLLLQCC